MKKFLLVAVTVLALAACRTAQVYEPEHPVPMQAQTLPLDRIEGLIVEAGQTRNWVFTRVAPGHLLAKQQTAKLEAMVDVYFDQKAYRLKYNSSVGMKENDGTISPHYNTWVQYLEKDIDVHLANGALKP